MRYDKDKFDVWIISFNPIIKINAPPEQRRYSVEQKDEAIDIYLKENPSRANSVHRFGLHPSIPLYQQRTLLLSKKTPGVQPMNNETDLRRQISW